MPTSRPADPGFYAGVKMRNVAKVLTALAALGFTLAVVSALTGRIIGIQAEGFSRASTNLALLAIAAVLVFEEGMARIRS